MSNIPRAPVIDIYSTHKPSSEGSPKDLFLYGFVGKLCMYFYFWVR